jgi:pyruvate/2-oxoglutarate dehydrogenase complex dihydrolipoamide dehydrogenase (E3) component
MLDVIVIGAGPAGVFAALRAANLGARTALITRDEFVGDIESFEKTPNGVRMNFSKDGARNSAEESLAVVAVGRVANTAGLSLAMAGVETDHRGFARSIKMP